MIGSIVKMPVVFADILPQPFPPPPPTSMCPDLPLLALMVSALAGLGLLAWAVRARRH